MTADVRSLTDLRERNTRRSTLRIARRAADVALRGALVALPVAIGLVGALTLAPTVTIPDPETLALTLVSIWSLVALFLTALLATGPLSR